MDCAAIGDAVACGLGAYNLTTFSDLITITSNQKEDDDNEQ